MRDYFFQCAFHNFLLFWLTRNFALSSMLICYETFNKNNLKLFWVTLNCVFLLTYFFLFFCRSPNELVQENRASVLRECKRAVTPTAMSLGYRPTSSSSCSAPPHNEADAPPEEMYTDSADRATALICPETSNADRCQDSGCPEGNFTSLVFTKNLFLTKRCSKYFHHVNNFTFANLTR